MSKQKFYYAVRGADKGDNVGEFTAATKEEAKSELEKIYDCKNTGLSIEILTKTQHDSQAKHLLEERRKEAEEVV